MWFAQSSYVAGREIVLVMKVGVHVAHFLPRKHFLKAHDGSLSGSSWASGSETPAPFPSLGLQSLR